MMMTEKQTFQTWTVISTVVSVIGFLLAALLWVLLPFIVALIDLALAWKTTFFALA